MSMARFIGVGVSEYDKGHPKLDHALSDVEAIAGLLAEAFDSTVAANPDEQAARACMKKVRGSMLGGGSLVLLWSGHAIPSPADGLRLLTRDSESYVTDGLGAASDVTGPCAESGANQILVIVDTCFSGEAAEAAGVAARILQQTPPAGKHVWIGVLTSCLPAETARDGLFGSRLAKLLESGPVTPELQVRWSRHTVLIRGDDLCDAVMKEWVSPAQSPDFLSRGSAWWMFPNPLYDPGAPEQVVEHLLLAARGGAAQDERSWFTGRSVEVDQVVAWVRSGLPGLHVITGSAGTGKTAIAGRVVSLSNPAERERLLAEGRPLGHADPGERSVDAHVHARGLTTDRAAEVIAGQLVRAGVLAAQQERRNAAELVGQVQRAVEQGAAPPVIVVDGLDEARIQAFTVAEELLLRLAPYAAVIVSTRELRRGQTEPSLLDVLTAGTAELDLDETAAQQRGQADMRAYITARLAGVAPGMDPAAVAGHLAEHTSMTGSEPFLLARLVTDQLRAAPVNTSGAGWQQQVSHSIEDAFDADLAQVHAPAGAIAESAGEAARILLAVLTWSLGAGLPEDEWLACANAITGDSTFGRDDVSWVLDELGRYIVQDGEAGVAVYRIAHQSLADHIRPPFAASYQQPFDPEARAIAAALLSRYQMLLAQGVPLDASAYLWRYAWRHAAVAGLSGLELLRDLAADQPGLLPDVAAADQEIAGRLRSWGYRLEAVPPSEEAVQVYRELAAGNPAFRPDLASALNNLGVCYSEVGRRQEAVPPSEEAVQLYQELAAGNPAFRPDLASALNNLGVRYGEVGRRQDGVAPTEEAVQLYRELAAGNPAFRPDLASALNNLGVCYGEVGRRQDGVAPAEEAVQLRRELAAGNPAFRPDLAGALSNLGNHYGQVGRRQDGVAPTEEAVRVYRQLAAGNPAFVPDLAMALNNLGVRYGEVGRRQEAVAPTDEAVQLRRELAAGNPAFVPDLASALNNLGNRYGEVGRRQEAVAPAEEAVRVYRELAAGNPAFVPDLAGALNNLGVCYSAVGRRQDGVAPAEEAVQLRRELAAGNPAFRPDLADALNNLGVCYGEVGRRQDGVAPAEEAVRVYRELAAGNPAFVPDLAMALNNLGVCYGEVGRRQDGVAPTEEAVQLRRELAAGNPAFVPDLAMALNNLGVRYGEVGRRQEAVAPTDEAVQLRRELAAGNPAFVPDLASALNNLGNRYGEVGRRQEAVAPAEEAVRVYRQLAAGNPAFVPDLAGALNNLGVCYGEVGRRQDGVAPAEEAVQLRRELAAGNPAFLPDLASALSNLGKRYTEARIPDGGDTVWEQAVGEAEPQPAARLLVIRAGLADGGHPAAADWLARALRLDGEARDLAAGVHEQARRHRDPDHDRFDEDWAHHTDGPPPAWLTVDADVLDMAQAWVATDTYQAERDYLAAHPKLLEPAAYVAVTEALLSITEEAADRYMSLRQAAQRDGVDAAYQPILLTILAHEFAQADPGRQRALMTASREDLLSDIVADVLQELAAVEGELAAAARRGAALIELAKSGDAEVVFEALAEPEQFPALLHTLAIRPSPASLAAAAVVAATAATSAAETATALFYFAVGTVVRGDQDQAAALIQQARNLEPAQTPAWINALAEIGQHHPAALTLIPALTAPADQPPPALPLSSGDS